MSCFRGPPYADRLSKRFRWCGCNPARIGHIDSSAEPRRAHTVFRKDFQKSNGGIRGEPGAVRTWINTKYINASAAELSAISTAEQILLVLSWKKNTQGLSLIHI